MEVKFLNMSEDFGKYKRDVNSRFKDLNEAIVKELEATEEKCLI